MPNRGATSAAQSRSKLRLWAYTGLSRHGNLDQVSSTLYWTEEEAEQAAIDDETIIAYKTYWLPIATKTEGFGILVSGGFDDFRIGAQLLDAQGLLNEVRSWLEDLGFDIGYAAVAIKKPGGSE